MSVSVELRNVDFDYAAAQRSADFDAKTLHGISLKVNAGDFLAIIGNNGAGKSTMTKLMNGLLRPSSGQVLVDGVDTARVPTSDLARKVGMLFQNPDHQICQPTVAAELAFTLQVQGTPAQEALHSARNLAQEFGLDPDADPYLLSRGQRQMVALASVLLTKPGLLILDEPTCGLDYRECTLVMEKVAQLHKAGTTVIMVCHDMELVYDHVSRLVVLSQGSIIADGGPETVFRDDKVMQRACVLPPQIIDVSQKLAAEGGNCAAFRHTASIAQMRHLLKQVGLKHAATAPTAQPAPDGKDE